MPLLDDARALLAIDRERRDIAKDHAAVLAEAEERARRLAELGDQERPKTLQFLTEAATLLPTPGAPGAPAAGQPLSSSGGGGGGAGGGGGTGGRRLTNRTLTALSGTAVRSESWVAAHCARTEVEIPRPGALRSDETVTVAAWDCTVPFRDLGLAVEDGAAIFLDPEATAGLLGPRSSSKQSGSGGNRGRDPRFVIPPITHVFAGGGEGSTVSGPPAAPSGPTAAAGASTAPTPDARLLQRELRDGFGALVKELRAGGDLGLQIRRNGGL